MTDLFQTRKNTGNPLKIENGGPYKCVREDAWLGQGYYFWDTFVELAHKWGKTAYNNNYIICKSSCSDDNMSLVYDLYDPQTLKDLKNITIKIQTKMSNDRKLYMKDIINLIKSRPCFKKYKAIRARFDKSLTIQDNHIDVLKNTYLDLTPPIQWCIIDKSILFNNYKIIYPQECCIDSFYY